MNEKYIDFLAEELQNQKLVIFVGAGVSMNSDLPSWSSLVKCYAEYMGIKKDNHEPNFIHKALSKLNLDYIITTNYDNLIESELNESNEYDLVTKDEELAYSKSKKMIIKMHGDIENRNVVLRKTELYKIKK